MFDCGRGDGVVGALVGSLHDAVSTEEDLSQRFFGFIRASVEGVGVGEARHEAGGVLRSRRRCSRVARGWIDRSTKL